MRRPPRTSLARTVAVVAAAAFLLLAVLVATGVTQSYDVAAREFFRPGGETTRAQARVDVLVEGLRPRNAAVLLAVVGLGTSLRRRSGLPVVRAATLGLVGGLAALAAKTAVGRRDPGNAMSALGGSFPSGHVLSVLVCLGGAVLVATTRPRWWHWVLVAVVTAAMGYSMLIQSAHWLTDVVGGALLGLSVLAAASARDPARGPAHRGDPGWRRPSGTVDRDVE